ncbi:MAG: hypothetical protein KDC08_09975 [Actinobacteria bacterium]|nr:hypothetical protein [Actinomycetota bacterium]
MEDAQARAEQWRLRCQEVGILYADAAEREVRANARIAVLEAELAGERARIAQILGSNSWKLTEPLRRARSRPQEGESAQDAGGLDEELFEARMRAAYDARAVSWPQPEPRTLNEKMWQRRLVDRSPLLRTHCDKHASYEYAAKVLPAEVMPERLGRVDTVEELADLDLPTEYIVKARHASGGSAVVWDGPPTQGQIWVYPWIRKSYSASDDPLPEVAEDLAGCLQHDYGWAALEWGYLGLPRQLLVERLYRDPGGGLPDDLRCLVFHGRVEFFEVSADRQRDTERIAGWHDREWNPAPIAMQLRTQAMPRPADLDQAIEMAEALAGDDPFVRVDWLLTSEGLKFSEITPYSHGGNARFATQAADELLGSFW